MHEMSVLCSFIVAPKHLFFSSEQAVYISAFVVHPESVCEIEVASSSACSFSYLFLCPLRLRLPFCFLVVWQDWHWKACSDLPAYDNSPAASLMHTAERRLRSSLQAGCNLHGPAR